MLGPWEHSAELLSRPIYDWTSFSYFAIILNTMTRPCLLIEPPRRIPNFGAKTLRQIRTLFCKASLREESCPAKVPISNQDLVHGPMRIVIAFVLPRSSFSKLLIFYCNTALIRTLAARLGKSLG